MQVAPIGKGGSRKKRIKWCGVCRPAASSKVHRIWVADTNTVPVVRPNTPFINSFDFDYDNSDGVTAGSYDFESVVDHA